MIIPKRVVIVGAGPAGCYTAQILKNHGYNPTIIEEHIEVGRPVHCTGLVGSNVLRNKWPRDIIMLSRVNSINGAVLHYEDQRLILRRKEVAYVIDREKFDKELSRGLDIIYQSRFLGLEKASSGYIVETDKGELPADIIIGADGANSVTRRIINRSVDIKYSKGVQFRVRTIPRYKDMVEVYLRYPDFLWVVPESEQVVRIGTISENPYKKLQDFMKEKKISGDILERSGGLVVTGICENTVKDNIALVGDAACQVKPLTYGGLYFGLMAASILASCIKKDALGAYDTLWKKELGFEIRIGMVARDLYDKLSRREISRIFGVVKRNKRLIEKAGDFDNHSRLILEIIKRPALYPRIEELFPILLGKIFQDHT